MTDTGSTTPKPRKRLVGILKGRGSTVGGSRPRSFGVAAAPAAMPTGEAPGPAPGPLPGGPSAATGPERGRYATAMAARMVRQGSRKRPGFGGAGSLMATVRQRLTGT